MKHSVRGEKPFSHSLSLLPLYYPPPKIIPITALILASSWCRVFFFFFTLPVDWERGLIQQAEVELTNLCRLHTAHNTELYAFVCVREKETQPVLPKMSVWVNAREKTTACIKKSPHLWLCPCMCVLELSALCCSVFFSLHNCQNVIPVTQRSSKPASSILKTI